jgi:ABC-2 type transport system permease protein
MTALIAAEWYKIRHSRVLMIILAGITAQTALQIVASSSLQETMLGQNGVTMLAENSSLLALWFAAFVGFFIASEFQNGTIRNVLALGKDRTQVFLSRLLSACIASAAIFAIVSLVATVGFSAAFGFGDIAPGEFLSSFAWTFSMQLVYQFTYAAVFTMFAFLSRNPGMSIILSVAYMIFVFASGGFLNNYPGGSLKFALQFYPQHYISEFSTLSGDPSFITNGLIVSAVYIISAFAIAFTVFKNSDVK